MILDQVIDPRIAGKLLVACIDHAVALGPRSDRDQVDIDEAGDMIAPIAESHRFLDVRKELELVLDIFWWEQRTISEPADILEAVDDREVPMLINQPGIARSDPAIHCLVDSACREILQILTQRARRSIEHLSRLVDSDFDSWKRTPHRVGMDLAIGLVGDIDRGFGLPVELLEVEPKRAVEAEDLRPDRLAG